MLYDALSFPFRSNVWRILLGWTGVFFLAGVAGILSTRWLSIAVIALDFLYFRQLLAAMMWGSGAVPHGPKITQMWRDLFVPLGQGVVLGVLCGVPTYLLMFGLVGKEGWLLLLPLAAAMLFTPVYFPMAMLSMLHYRSVWDALPNIVVPAIFRGGAPYAAVVLIPVLIMIASNTLALRISSLLLLSTGINAFLKAYSTLALARVLGQFYRNHRQRLKWEELPPDLSASPQNFGKA